MRIAKQSVLYNAMILGVSGIAIQLLGFVYRVLLNRVLGAEGMGVYQLIFPFQSMIIAISMSGIGVGVTSIAARLQAENDVAGNRRLMRMALLAFVVFFIALAVPAVLFLDFITKSILGEEQTRLALLILLPCIFFTGFENIYKSFFHGIHKVQITAFSEQLEFYIRILFVAALAFFIKPTNTELSVALVVCGMLISEIFSSSLLGRLFRKEIKQTNTKSKPGSAIGWQLMRIAIPATITGVLSHLLGSVNTILLPRRLEAAGLSQSAAISTLGIYFGMATPLLMLPMAVSGPLAIIILPKLSQGIATRNLSDVRRKIGKAIQAISLLAVPFILLLIPVAPTLCRIIFGQSVPESSFALIACSTVLACYQVVLGSAINGIGLPKRNVIFVVVGGCIQLAFTYYVTALPGWGIYGTLTGGIASAFCMALLSLFTIRRKVNLRIRWLRWVFLPVVCAAVSGLCCRLLFLFLTQHHQPNIFDALECFAAGSFVYLFTLKLQGIRFFRYLRTLVPKKQAD